jgi:putative flippase GtrA
VLARLISFGTALFSKLIGFALKFGVVGLVCYFIDVGIFNWLRLSGDSLFIHTPIGAKLVSAGIATVVSWFANRYWTFREDRRKNYLLELLEFAAVAIGGLLIGLACLWVSHYVLGFTSLVADNIAANVIGLVLGTAFRFLLYRYWVYGTHRSDGLAARNARAEATLG